MIDNSIGIQYNDQSRYLTANPKYNQYDRIITKNECKNDEFSLYVNKPPTDTKADSWKGQLVHKKMTQQDKLKQSSNLLINNLLCQTTPPTRAVKKVLSFNQGININNSYLNAKRRLSYGSHGNQAKNIPIMERSYLNKLKSKCKSLLDQYH